MSTCQKIEAPTQEAVLLSDMEICQPSSAISSAGLKDHWRLINYETENGISGKMLYSGEEGAPEEISISLELTGWYRIYVGLGATNLLAVSSPPGIRLKLDKEPCYVKICAQGPQYWLELKEYFWKEACLEDGEKMHFAKVKGSMSCIAYLRFEPMNNEEIEQVKERKTKKEEHFLIATNDSYWEYNNIDEILENILPLQDSSVRKLFFCVANGDTCYYMDTKVGSRVKLQPNMGFPRTIDRKIFEGLNNLNNKEADVLAKVCNFTHKIGLEFHASFRVEAFANQPPHDMFRSNFFADNPQFRCRDRDGREIARLSYAFEEVQNHMLALYEEVLLNYDIDGLNLIFVRALPVMLYEQPILEGFKSIYGKDPLHLDEDNSVFLQYRASLLTEFMRRIRKKVDVIRQTGQ